MQLQGVQNLAPIVIVCQSGPTTAITFQDTSPSAAVLEPDCGGYLGERYDLQSSPTTERHLGERYGPNSMQSNEENVTNGAELPPNTCEICSQFAKVPYPECSICGAEPSWHHKRCCEKKKKEEQNKRRCEVCLTFATVPYEYCGYCGASPSYHHGRCCPGRPRDTRQKTSISNMTYSCRDTDGEDWGMTPMFVNAETQEETTRSSHETLHEPKDLECKPSRVAVTRRKYSARVQHSMQKAKYYSQV